MRDVFRAYYAPAGQELDALWTEGIIVLDTNTLLNFFRYTPSTRDEFLSVLESLQDSLWIPHQVGLEFQRRRLEVISNTADAFSKVKASVGTARNAVTGKLNEYKHHPSLNRNELTKQLDKLFERFSAKVDAQAEQHAEWIAGDGDPERTFFRISDLYDQRVGQGFSREELDAIEEDGKQRYEHKVPPGYKDANKTNGNEYGDLVIWKEILRLGEAMKKPVIFVTDDAKEDWWLIERGQTQGARPELIDEYWAAAERRIHLYEPLQFLKHAKERTQIAVSDNSLDEVQEVSSGNERARRVLHERREQLVQLREGQLRNIERHRSDGSTSRQRADMHTELAVLTEEQRFLETQRQVLEAQGRRLVNEVDELEPTYRDEQHMHRVTATYEERAAVETRLAHLAKRREALERGIREREPREERMAAVWERRVRAIDEELHDVSLALDELES
ncbi:PIN-like domain-containing protein [Curtobacterium sp. MCBA15_001]|uniref:PIN-like domain-containing protein n=1 Tax=Curtobacterium sp. MCBA15_001 TaxID=1898731 RepID=UPI0011143575|nr:PIN-like domain-containing protein [Curtobacterium sp. MCBA15_001]